jgi:predicted acylesterase/phospholipase RssA
MTPPSIRDVLAQEHQQIQTSRNLRLGENQQRPAPQESLIGLAFSGGGIRSATFNLGVLQALAKKELLRSIDYVSTVSGGGYIGGWLMGWMHHQGIGIQEIEKRLSTPPKAPEEAGDPPEIHFLRDYSNYLTPRKGLLRADFLAFAASYLRNTLLNQIILVMALLFLLLVPRSIVYILHVLEDLEELSKGKASEWLQPYMQSQYFALAVALGFGLLAVTVIGGNLETVDPHKSKKDYWFTTSKAVHLCIIFPLIASAALFAYGCSQFLTQWGIVEKPQFRAPAMGIAFYLTMWIVACSVREARRFKRKRDEKEKGKPESKQKEEKNDGPASWIVLLTAAMTGIVIGYLFVPFAHVLIHDFDKGGLPYSNWRVMTFGPPAAILIMLLAGVIHIGLMGSNMTEAYREWWGRLGGYLMLFALCWLALFMISIFFPYELGRLLSWERAHPSLIISMNGVPVHLMPASGVLAWIASTAYGVFFGKSEKTGKWNPDASWSTKLLAIAAKLTPYIFILGLLLCLSVLASYLSNWAKHVGGSPLVVPSDFYFDIQVPLLCLVFIAGAVVVSWRVDINEFSIHYLYRDRLVRCYLGASVPERKAQPFTGFSEEDNFPLSRLEIPLGSVLPKHGRPLPILNTSLNVVRGKELALQTRKARSFALTPSYGGFTRALPDNREWEAAYAPTKELASKLPGFQEGITIGTAVAISGAAASPNMGSYSDPALGFLMTLFDVRLGWWIGNPRREGMKNENPRVGFAAVMRKLFGSKRDGWKNGSPRVGFACLLQELLGNTSDDSKYVYLSDGGHFENLAVYELVRRRCKLIIASDASCDSAYAFGDLFNAIERCRTDFGVEIIMQELQEIRPKANPDDPSILRAEAHFAVGKIRYNPDLPEEDGTIIYLKPALLESDPCDVLAYATKDKAFPHDTTANQWFDEAHFENYRALGEASGSAASGEIAAEIHRILG